MSTTDALDPVERISLGDLVAERIRQAILTGALRPGQRVTEDELARVLGISRSPVRQALIQLEHEGLIVRERNQRASVVCMSEEDIEEVCTLRLSLETLALERAMARATAEDIAELEGLFRKYSKCLRGGGPLARLVELDLAFHEQLVHISRHSRLLHAWEGIRFQISYLMFTCNIVGESEFPSLCDVWHSEIIEALRRKDLAHGTQHLRAHLENAYDVFRTRYAQQAIEKQEGRDHAI